MEKVNVLIIGGGPSGIIAAITGISTYPDKKFLLIRKEKEVIVPCGIPYLFGSLAGFDKKIVPYDSVLLNSGVKLKIDEVISLDTKKKICKTAKGSGINFEKLIFALGSTPYIPEWLKEKDIENIFTMPKNKNALDKIFSKLKKLNKIVIIGGGFIGVEVSDELNRLGKDVTILETSPHVLCPYCDEEITYIAEKVLKKSGIKIKYGLKPNKILGTKKVTGILLENGKKIEADAIIVALGYHPNTALAIKSGIKTNELGFIKVNEHMRTDNPDIFAVGDCAEKKDFITKKVSTIMLSSTACAEARVAGTNIYRSYSKNTFNGAINLFFTAIGKIGFGTVGFSEKLARQEGLSVVTETFESFDKQLDVPSGINNQFVKLIVARDSGIILGGEVIDGRNTGELTNLIGILIQNKMTIDSFLKTQFGTHPLLTAPPSVNPLIKVAEIIAMKMNPVQ